jgi:histidinol-phosphate aminotransferase
MVIKMQLVSDLKIYKMVDVNNLVRDNVIKLTPYSCARDEFNGKTGIFLDANENPFGNLNRYPDPYQKELKVAISKIKGVEEDRIFLGNGSDEIIDLCFRVFCNPGTDKALTFTPTYGMYEVSASINDVKVVKIPLNELFQIDIKKVEPWFSDNYLKLIFICSPNNPTGNSMNYSDVEYIIANFKGIVIIDEAYIDFSNTPSFINMVDRYPNLIVMQTFSKSYGLAAARVGMAFSNPAIIKYFNKLKPPYNISKINQDAAIQRLDKDEKNKIQIRKIKKEKEKLSAELGKMKITEKVWPSDANFILVKVTDADHIYNTLVDKSIIVRNRSSIVDNCLRITVGTPSENNKLINVLKSIAE